MAGDMKMYSLTLEQQDIYYDQLHNKLSPKYNIGGYIDILNCNLERLLLSHRKLIESNPIFSLIIKQTPLGARVVLENSASSDVVIEDFSSEAEPLIAALLRVKKLFSILFNLDGNYLHRTYVLKISSERFWYVGIAHHIIMDGVGFANWAQQISNYYSTGCSYDAKDSIEQYFQQSEEYLKSKRFLKDHNFWSSYLIGVDYTVFEPIIKSELESSDKLSCRYNVTMERSQLNSLINAHEEFSQSTHSLYLSLLFVVFSRLTGKKQISIGMPMHNRNGKMQKNMLAHFMSVSPIVLNMDESYTFNELLELVKIEQKSLLRHQRFPISKMVSALSGNGRGGLYEIGFSYLSVNDRCLFDDVETNFYYIENEFQSLPFNLTVWDGHDDTEITWQIDYNLNYFNAFVIKQVADIILHLLQQVSDNPDKKISDLSLVLGKIQFQPTSVFVKQNYRLFGPSFASIVKLNPNLIAVSCDKLNLTYQQLDYLSDLLAQQLFDNGVKRGNVVGVMLERSPLIIVAMIAVMKVNAVFLPLQSDYPLKRMHFIIEDSCCSLVISSTENSIVFSELFNQVICLEPSFLAEHNYHVLNFKAEDTQENSPCYLLYTSGSTGNPKGVLVSHGAFANFLNSMAIELPFAATDTILATTPVSFDISLLELFLPLYVGGTVKVFPHAVTKALPELLVTLAETDVTFLQMTPSGWKLLIAAGWTGDLRLTALSGGEVLPGWLAQKLRGMVKSLLNMYGPTETTIWSSISLVDERWQLNNIGFPIHNTHFEILDANKRPVPDGWRGQLFIGGDGVANEYLHREDLTERVFSQTNDIRWYDTGDIVCKLEDGSYQFFCRKDTQIKFSGYRIEAEEIERVICQHNQVRDSIVKVTKLASGVEHLCAYYVTKNNQQVESSELQSLLRAVLPYYMIPSHFCFLAEFPLTPSGKTDFKALPVPKVEQIEQAQNRTDEKSLAHSLATLIADRFGIDHLESSANFFDAGINSNDMAKMSELINTTFNTNLSVIDLFTYSTANALANHLNSHEQNEAVDNAEVAKKTDKGRSRLQNRLERRRNVNV